MKKLFIVLISVLTLNFIGCGSTKSSDEARALLTHNLKLVGIPQEIVVNICQDKNDNGSCDEGELQAKVSVNSNDSISQIWEKVKFEVDGRYILENYDSTLSIIMEIDGSKVAEYNNVDLTLTYKSTTQELSVLQAVVDADFLKEEDVAKLKALENREEIDKILFNSLTKNQSLLEEQNLTKESALIINLEEIAKGLIDSNVSKELPERLEACANNNTCIKELVKDTSNEVELTEEEAIELARSKNIADGYIVKLSKPVMAVCANGKEYNSSLNVGKKGKIDFEIFPVGIECNITVPKGAIIDSNNNGTFDLDDKSLEFEMVGSAEDTFISPLTTLLFKKREKGEDVHKFALMIQNFDPVVAPNRVTKNTGIEKLEIEKLVILMEVLKTSMKQSADITKLNLSGIINTNKTDTIESLNIDTLIAQFSTEIRNNVKEKALAIKDLVKKLQDLNPAKIDINSFFVSISDGGKNITDAIRESLLVSLPSGIDPFTFIGTPTEVKANKAPRAKAGVDQNVTEGTEIILDASKSSDGDGEIKTYKWTEGGKILGTTSLLKISDFSVGSHTVILTVKDNNGAIGSDTLICTINKKKIIITNNIPSADAGEDKYVIVNNSISLTGIGRDSDGTVRSYQWKEGTKVLASTALFNYKPKVHGNHILTLEVTDNNGGIASDDVVIYAYSSIIKSIETFDKRDGLFLSFSESGDDIAKQENIPLHPNGTFKIAEVDSWTDKAIGMIDYKLNTKLEVYASKMWWSDDRCPMKIEFLDQSSNVLGKIEFNPESYSGNSVYFYRNEKLIYTHKENNQSIENSEYDGSFSGIFEFTNNKIKFNSFYSPKSFGTNFEVDYDLSNVKYIRSTTQALGTYSTGRAISYTKLLTNLDNITIGSSSITGKVQNAITQSAIPNVTIKLSTNGKNLQEVKTNNSGIYTLVNLREDLDYSIEVLKEDYLTVFYSNITLDKGIIKYLETILDIEKSYAGNGDISGKITNSINGNGLSSVVINFRKGINAQIGTIVQTTTTQTDGLYSITELEAGSYTGELTSDGYQTSYITVVVLGGKINKNQNGSINPILNTGEIRIVLTWGENPSDLDSHLTGPISGSSERFHIYFSNEGSINSTPYSNLDVDETSSYGPETITIRTQEAGVYRYSVQDYSNQDSASSNALSNSGATVKIYKGAGLVSEFFVPNKEGTLWKVFEIDGGVIKPINHMEYHSSEDNIEKMRFSKKKK